MANADVEIGPNQSQPQSTSALLYKSFMVMMTNLIPLYGVLRLGWSSFLVILLFIIEGVVVLIMDLIKRPYVTSKERGKVLFFEVLFISFFGFFAILIFGRSEDSTELPETIRTSFQAARELPLWPIIGLVVMRLIRTGQELMDAGVFYGSSGKPLYFSGGGWMLLLFFLVMTAPLIADKNPNAMAGLIVIIAFKVLGEVFAVWAHRFSPVTT